MRVLGREIVEHVAEIDIGHVAERDDMREADAARRRPIEHRGDHRAGLADEGDVARRRREMRKARVEPDAGHDDADAVRPDEAQQMRPRGVEHGLLQRAARFAQFAEPGGDHDSGPGAARAEFGDEARHRVGRRGDDREIGRLRQARDVRIHRHAVRASGVMRVDQQQLAGKPGAAQVAQRRPRRPSPARSVAPISATERGRNSFRNCGSTSCPLPNPGEILRLPDRGALTINLQRGTRRPPGLNDPLEQIEKAERGNAPLPLRQLVVLCSSGER